MQPWLGIVLLGKDIENRNWPTQYRGPVLLHASKTWDKESFPFEKKTGRFWSNSKLPFPEGMSWEMEGYPQGGFCGMVTITDCVARSNSPWFFGKYGFVLKDARAVTFTPLRGQLGFFDVPDDIVQKLLSTSPSEFRPK